MPVQLIWEGAPLPVVTISTLASRGVHDKLARAARRALVRGGVEPSIVNEVCSCVPELLALRAYDAARLALKWRLVP